MVDSLYTLYQDEVNVDPYYRYRDTFYRSYKRFINKVNKSLSQMHNDYAREFFDQIRYDRGMNDSPSRLKGYMSEQGILSFKDMLITHTVQPC